MGFMLSVGNQGASGSQLQKRLLKHFNLPARDVVTAGRQFPISSRIDLQSGLENLLNVDAATTLLGLVSPNSHESLTFAQMLGGPHAHVNVGPLQYDDVDIGDSVPTRALKNGLWMGRHNGQPFAILLAPGGRFGFQTGVGVEVAVPVGDAGAQFSQNFFRQLEQQIVQGRTYRGRVISLEAHHHPMGGGSSVKVHRLAKVAREQVILPQATLATLDRNVAGFIALRGELKSMHFQARKGCCFTVRQEPGRRTPFTI
jgi:hypothetical protein